jgi:phasin family protein
VQQTSRRSTYRKPLMMKFDQFAAATKPSVDTLFRLSAQAFESAEQLTALNLQTIKTLLAESQETSQAALLLAKNPAAVLELQAKTLQAVPQKAMAYGRQVQAIFAPIAATQRATFDAQIADVQAKFLDAVNGAMKDAPGAEKFLALAKSAVAAANNAYGDASKVTKQVSNALSANVAKVTEAAVKTSQGALATIEV